MIQGVTILSIPHRHSERRVLFRDNLASASAHQIFLDWSLSWAYKKVKQVLARRDKSSTGFFYV